MVQIGTGGFLNPQKIVNEIGIIDDGMKIADFGSGNGYFSLPLAKKVGDGGKVFALDVLDESLEAISSQKRIQGIENIETKKCNLELEKGSKLLEKSFDIVWIANLLFQTEKDEVVIMEAKRILKPKGRLVFIDWKPGVSLGPQGGRVSPDDVKKLIENEGFFLERNFSTDSYHFGLIFKKND